jgi:flagellar basal body-associated protein FliL
MKGQDIAALVLIVVFAAIGSFILSGKIIKSDTQKQQAETVQPITPEFILPPSYVFNTNAINPTLIIEIAPNDNPDPFANSQ